MNLANKPAYPIINSIGGAIQTHGDTETGLTMRQHFAGLALQGVLANPESADVMPTVAKKNGIQMAVAYAMVAVEYADALIAQLEKEETKP